MKKTRNATSINADGAGTHLPVYRARTKQVKKIADTLNLNLKSTREMYLAKMVAVSYFNFPLINYREGWRNT
jgi:hypothetical protein